MEGEQDGNGHGLGHASRRGCVSKGTMLGRQRARHREVPVSRSAGTLSCAPDTLAGSYFSVGDGGETTLPQLQVFSKGGSMTGTPQSQAGP